MWWKAESRAGSPEFWISMVDYGFLHMKSGSIKLFLFMEGSHLHFLPAKSLKRNYTELQFLNVLCRVNDQLYLNPWYCQCHLFFQQNNSRHSVFDSDVNIFQWDERLIQGDRWSQYHIVPMKRCVMKNISKTCRSPNNLSSKEKLHGFWSRQDKRRFCGIFGSYLFESISENLTSCEILRFLVSWPCLLHQIVSLKRDIKNVGFSLATAETFEFPSKI